MIGFLSCTHLAHRELESVVFITVVVIIIIILIVTIIISVKFILIICVIIVIIIVVSIIVNGFCRATEWATRKRSWSPCAAAPSEVARPSFSSGQSSELTGLRSCLAWLGYPLLLSCMAT